MRHVITFIASQPNLIDLGATVTRLTASVAGMPIRWLEPGVACDVELEHRLPEIAWQKIRDAAHAQRIDCVMQPLATREKKLLVSDMDSTLIEQECIDELAACVGLRAEVSAITARAMNGELDFATALRERVGLLKGLSTSTLQRVYDEQITPMQGAATLLATLKSRGVYTVLVSGGFTFFTAHVAAALGFDAQEANRLEMAGELLTGRVVEPILGREAKREALLHFARQRAVPLSACVAIGDGANDLPMLQTAGLGVAYHAKPAVVAHTHAAIHFNDLSALLYVQGIETKHWAQ
ncbi:MAG: phosphoserine phosphatase SerB [Rickettsiales bacterium]